MNRNILVTGGAGFIGSHLVDELLKSHEKVTVLDNFNDFYSQKTKRENIVEHLKEKNYKLIEGDLRDRNAVTQAFSEGPFDAIVHLAAMAGVRPSLEKPALYMEVNINGTQNLLDQAIISCPQTRFVFGSSSSVYGNRSGEKFLETDRVDQPLSPYAASKAAAELACYAAHHTHGLSVSSLRFFTVYGPRQRPDLAIHKFCQKIHRGEPIEVYGDGNSKRDYTFISDIIFGIIQATTYDCSGFDIINLGRSDPVLLSEMISTIESALGKKAKIERKDFQMGDMPYTFADVEKAKKLLQYDPVVDFTDGIKLFVDWFLQKHAAAKI
jgi:UDP-glucuronate 4-epimerase